MVGSLVGRETTVASLGVVSTLKASFWLASWRFSIGYVHTFLVYLLLQILTS
jgi:hypothetical protein